MTTRPPAVDLIDAVDSPYGEIEIGRERRTGTLIYAQGRIEQSRADRNGISLAPYIHGLYGLLRQVGAADVLLIGCGGGTLGTMLSRDGVKVTIVDIDAASFEMAHRHFALPHSVICRTEDGAGFMERTRRRYDAIVLDAYHDDRIPPAFTSPRFLAAAARRLKARRGLFLANVFVRSDRDRSVRHLAATLAEHWSPVRVLDEPGARHRNAIVMAGAVAHLEPPTVLVRPTHGVREIRRWMRSLSFQTVASAVRQS